MPMHALAHHHPLTPRAPACIMPPNAQPARQGAPVEPGGAAPRRCCAQARRQQQPAARCAARRCRTTTAAANADAFSCIDQLRGVGARARCRTIALRPHASLRCGLADAAPQVEAAPRGERPLCTLYDMYDQQVPYVRAWAWQKALLRRRLAALDAGLSAPGELLLLQHPPVFTLGTGSTPAHLRFDPAAPPFELHRTERGGEATYHGPGQLVLYPILDLKQHTPDLHWYMRSLEEVAIRALATLGLRGERIDGLTGTWCDGRKLAAQGVRAQRWVTYHGLALNVAPDLTHFAHIVPCGIADRPVGSVAERLAAQAGACCAPGGVGAEAPPALMAAARGALLGAFEDVFDVRLAGCDAPAEALDGVGG